MIEINFDKQTYTCPYCSKEQAFSDNNSDKQFCGYKSRYFDRSYDMTTNDLNIYNIKCSNIECHKIITVAKGIHIKKQWDLIPDNVYRNYPDYIPQQIRSDYVEAVSILDKSPKAAATLLRRCLQGMIHDFWNIHEKNLNAEITALQGKIPPTQWKAIDSLRKLGNIGAHMEQDVNLIVDIEKGEAQKLQKLIETLLEKWYISRHDEETLYNDIIQTSDDKQDQRKTK